MSFLYKKVAAQDLSGNVIVVKHGNIWNIESPNEPHRKLIGSNFLSRAEAEKTAKEVGYSVSGVYEDSRKNGIAEYVKAQDGNSEFIIEHSRIPIAQLGGEENAKKSGYIVAKKNGRTYGVHIDGYSDELTRRTLKDAGYAFDGCEGEDAAQDSLPTVGGYITLKKDGKKYKILKDWGGGEYIVANPNGGDFQVKYNEHLEGLKHYGKDAAEFKVGDKVKHTQYGTIGKVFEIDPAGNVGVQWNNGQAYYGKTAKPLSLIIAADSAAMDARSDVRMHLHEAEDHIVGVVNSFTNYAVDKTAKEIAAINELKGVIGIIHKVASVF